MARVAESGLGRKDLVIINSHLSSPTDEFRASARPERKRERERAAVANARYCQPAPKPFDLFGLIMH